ncbi:MAG: NAD(P)H-quinone dehydrogenase [Tetrasphaera sp.]
MSQHNRVVVVGGGPGGYEAALVAAHLGAAVTVVDSDGLGGAAVLTDCVPSKTLISTADYLGELEVAADLGVHLGDDEGEEIAHASADLARVNTRVLALAKAQSQDIARRLGEVGVRVARGTAYIEAPDRVRVDGEDDREVLPADVLLLATGAAPRVMATATPDGERILTWQQIYTLPRLPEHLIVVGSGVTGAELAQAYLGLGSRVTLVSSREHVLPGEDPDAARVIEEVFTRRGMSVLARSRMAAAEVIRNDAGAPTGVLVTLEDGRVIDGSHALLAVGSVPRTSGVGLTEAGIALTPSGHIAVDRVSRTSVRGVYAAGDCTGVLPLASVAAMQGRIAMAHALGDAVAPLRLEIVCANIFTDPEIATVGVSEKQIAERGLQVHAETIPLGRNPRAKMLGIADGFVKLFAEPGSGTLLGGVIVAPRASELIFPVTLGVSHRLNVDQVASAFTVYPSLTGSIAEAARRLHGT